MTRFNLKVLSDIIILLIITALLFTYTISTTRGFDWKINSLNFENLKMLESKTPLLTAVKVVNTFIFKHFVRNSIVIKFIFATNFFKHFQRNNSFIRAVLI